MFLAFDPLNTATLGRGDATFILMQNLQNMETSLIPYNKLCEFALERTHIQEMAHNTSFTPPVRQDIVSHIVLLCVMRTYIQRLRGRSMCASSMCVCVRRKYLDGETEI